MVTSYQWSVSPHTHPPANQEPEKDDKATNIGGVATPPAMELLYRLSLRAENRILGENHTGGTQSGLQHQEGQVNMVRC
ncbi:hypothetical protein JZ751_006277 [Albula glossodonta]|uniref:Uncharacterized protein n=1 Tax=Albula glossodonta TaxID=121402 RepID=A0A8T2N4K6_9TELE|nr:hypothetical protein JZ751_006277 [Albula glossodonta]